MDPEYPKIELNLVATSVADDLGYRALVDLATVLSEQDVRKDCRLIGGHMVTLHVHRWGLGPELYRETVDADLGITTVAVRQLDISEALTKLGYAKTAGARFEKPVDGHDASAIIDVLVPTYTSRARKSVKHGELTTTEVLGLATTLSRPPVSVELNVTYLDGSKDSAALFLPDEPSALMLKALAFKTRNAGKDAVDIWRCLEVLHRAALSIADEPGDDFAQARDLIANGFADMASPMMQALIRQQKLSHPAAQQRHTRLQALIKVVCGD